MNMNFATWGHLMMSILPRYSSFSTFGSSLSATSPDLLTLNIPRPTVRRPRTPSPLPRSDRQTDGGTDGRIDRRVDGCVFTALCFLRSDPPEIRLSVSDDRASAPVTATAASEPTAVPEVHVETVPVLSCTQCRVPEYTQALWKYLSHLHVLFMTVEAVLLKKKQHNFTDNTFIQ